MQGTYRVYKSGLLVAEQPNVITTRGRALILRYLAGSLGSYAGSMVIGTSHVVPSVNDTKLGFEIGRAPVNLGAADVPNSVVIFKATMPVETNGLVHELGLYPFTRRTESEYAGQVYLGFEPTLESLSGGGVNTTNFRMGAESYEVTANAEGNRTVTSSIAPGNFAGYSGSDTFSLSYFLNDAFTSSIKVTLYVDNSNYFTYTVSTSSAPGYYVTDWTKSAFTATGSPSWENIQSADFVVNARAGGPTTVQLDGMRVNDTDVYPDYGLVSRAVLENPVPKSRGEQMDIEYALRFDL